MKTVFLHIGYHKTGSTTVQSFLASAREELTRVGILFPDFNYGDIVFNNQSVPLMSVLEPAPSMLADHYARFDHPASMLSDHRQAVYAAMETAVETIVFSAEHLGTQLTRKQWGELIAFFSSFGYKTNILAYVRDPYKKTLSTIQERLKAGIPISDSLYFVDESKQVSFHRDLFGDAIEFKNFDEIIASDQGLIADFAETVGIPSAIVSEVGVPKNQNMAVSLQAAQLLDSLNQQFPFMIAPGIRNPLRFEGDDQGIKVMAGEKYSLLRHQAEVLFDQGIEGVYARVNESLPVTCRIGSPKDHDLGAFPADVNWSISDIRRLFKTAIYCSPIVIASVYKYFQDLHLAGKLSEDVFEAVSGEIAALLPRRSIENKEKVAKLLLSAGDWNISNEDSYQLAKLAVYLDDGDAARKNLAKLRADLSA